MIFSHTGKEKALAQLCTNMGCPQAEAEHSMILKAPLLHYAKASSERGRGYRGNLVLHLEVNKDLF